MVRAGASWHHVGHIELCVRMKSFPFPLPAIVAALAATVAFPFSLAAAGTLAFTAALGCIIHADYRGRCCRVRLPRLAVVPAAAATPARPSRERERHPFAA